MDFGGSRRFIFLSARIRRGLASLAQRFRAIGVDGTDFTTGTKMDELPDIDANRSNFNILSWALEPGDALLFHGLTVHGSRGNRSSQNKRRAIATRWCGDDVVYQPTARPELYRHDLRAGDPFSANIFPQVLPAILESQIKERLAGPIHARSSTYGRGLPALWSTR